MKLADKDIRWIFLIFWLTGYATIFIGFFIKPLWSVYVMQAGLTLLIIPIGWHIIRKLNMGGA
jgi:hypothetical protein